MPERQASGVPGSPTPEERAGAILPYTDIGEESAKACYTLFELAVKRDMIATALRAERERALRWVDALQRDNTSFESATEGIREGKEPPC